MLNHNDVLEKLNEYKIDAYTVSTNIDETSAFHFEDLEEFILFVKKQNVSFILYSYVYLDEEFLLINENVISDLKLKAEMINAIQEEIDEYNSRVEKLDFSIPVALKLYCVLEGIVYYTDIYDFWFLKQGFDYPENVLSEIAEKNMDEMLNVLEKANKKRDKKLDELKRKILSDSQFYNCTNSQLRRAYTYNLLNTDEIKKLFYFENGATRDIHPIVFIEGIWREYKMNSKNAK